MPLVKFIKPDGDIREVHAKAGSSLMQAAVDNGIDEIVAECGGCCSCATCHCYIDEAWMETVGQPSDMEKDMLDCVLEPADNSRLSCQVELTDGLDGLLVRVPAAQF